MQKPIKILMLVENLPVPADPRVWKEATALHEAGFQVCVISPKGTTRQQEPYICIDGIHIYRYQLPTTANRGGAYLKEYSTALLMTFLLSLKIWFRHGFDVIHAANPPDVFFLLGWCYRLLGKKYIFDQHDLAPEMFQVKFKGRMHLLLRLLLICEWCSYRVAHIVIVTNLSQKWNATERGGCPPHKVMVVRNGPDLTRLQPTATDPELKRGRPYLLAYVGVMGVQDGIENALYALQRLVYQRRRQDVSLVLMGSGDHLSTLQALTHELRLDDYVNFTGWVESAEMTRYLCAADIGLCPDPQNGLNEYCTMLKAMEYMAMRKPVVAFDLTETRFSAQDAALYAAPNSVEDFTRKIEMLLEDEQLRMQLGIYGRNRIETALCWEQSKEHLLNVYQRLFPAHFESVTVGEAAFVAQHSEAKGTNYRDNSIATVCKKI
ncbi:MAG TPA: glycosyltransferase family 4 protein [Ktedonobacteraceae bacterium]|nr:glycosyltransferase family 4 protein [Ktedonobacteraceae bacterium]